MQGNLPNFSFSPAFILFIFIGFLFFSIIDELIFKQPIYIWFYLIFLIEFFENSYFLPNTELKNQLFDIYSRTLEPLMFRIREFDTNYYSTILLSNLSLFLSSSILILLIKAHILKFKWYFLLLLLPKIMDMIAKLILFDKINKKRLEGLSLYDSFDKLRDQENLDVFWPQKNIVEYLYIPYINSLFFFFLFIYFVYDHQIMIFDYLYVEPIQLIPKLL